MLIVQMDNTIVNVALPTIGTDLQTGLMILPTAATALVSAPLAGRLLGVVLLLPVVSTTPRAQASAERVAARFAEDTHTTWPSGRRGARP